MVPTKTGSEYAPASTPPSVAAVSALGGVPDAGSTDVEPMARTADSVDALVSDRDGGVGVSWTQAGCDVTVAGEGLVTVSPARDGRPEQSGER